MRFTEQVEIDRPRAEVVRLFLDAATWPSWQLGLAGAELVAGRAGHKGAVTRLVLVRGSTRREKVHTVVARHLPRDVDVTEDTGRVHAVLHHRFDALGAGRTRWVTEAVVTFSGAMRVAGLLFRASFPLEARNEMQRFKDFAERGTDVRETARR